MDVKTAFLHGNLDEEIYMEQPEGFTTPGNERKFCKLQRSIYGLKQSSRQWYHILYKEIVGNGFVNLHEDACFYYKIYGSKYVILTLYVDDILIAANDVSFTNKSKSWLAFVFEMKYMGEAMYILGIKIARDRASWKLFLSQESYINKLLKRFRLQDTKPVDAPVVFGCALSKRDGPKNLVEREQITGAEYLSMVGSYWITVELRYGLERQS